tara:strand:- start:3118 stop:3825 length:708 start_codon:yes stop_codon:yes gene_type:complete
MKIAISGKMCSGKSTLKEFIKDKLLNCYNQIQNNGLIPLSELSFGHPIKEMYYTLFNYSKNKNRKAFQSIGDTFRAIDRDVFAKRVIEKCVDDKIIILDDLRFKNEMKYLKENGFICIRIDIAEDIQRSRFYKLYPGEDYENTRGHISEVDLDNCRHFDLIVGQDQNDFQMVWNFLMKNYKDDICKILFKDSSSDNFDELSLYSPARDVLTGKYIHQCCDWHSHRYEIYNLLDYV